MEYIEINGGRSLNGEICIQGSKNAALPILAATLLHRGETVLHNCPKIRDTVDMTEILRHMGCRITWSHNTVCINAESVTMPEVSEGLGSRMRSSVIFLGALLGRENTAKIPFPGGCTIGRRPIDIHLEALRMMNAEIEEKEGMLQAKAGRLRGISYRLHFPSVGATENMILAAVMADGVMEISNCAREPEIQSLCEFLNEKGAKITGAGTEKICITGVKKLTDSEYRLPADRIVGGTYLFGVLATRGCCLLKEAPIAQMQNCLRAAQWMGAQCSEDKKGLYVDGKNAGSNIMRLQTAPYPGFPTDLQSQLMSVLSIAHGNSCIIEEVFESRFKVAEELNKMGAHITVAGREASIYGVKKLHGEVISAEELRGGAALVIAGMAAEGQTRINNAHYICRGYEDICRDFCKMGADIYWGR